MVSRIDGHGCVERRPGDRSCREERGDRRDRHRSADGGVQLGGRYQWNEEQADLQHRSESSLPATSCPSIQRARSTPTAPKALRRPRPAQAVSPGFARGRACHRSVAPTRPSNRRSRRRRPGTITQVHKYRLRGSPIKVTAANTTITTRSANCRRVPRYSGRPCANCGGRPSIDCSGSSDLVGSHRIGTGSKNSSAASSVAWNVAVAAARVSASANR